jgi:hypothetical protein
VGFFTGKNRGILSDGFLCATAQRRAALGAMQRCSSVTMQ